MNNVRRNLQKYLYPELYLSDAINKNIAGGLNTNIDYNSIFRAFVVSGGYAKNNYELYDESPDGSYKVKYPRNYIRAFVLGLDEGLPEKYCRVFRPSTMADIRQEISDYSLISVTFEDENFSSGIWMGKILDTVDTGSFKSIIEKYNYNPEINNNNFNFEQAKNYIDYQENNGYNFSKDNQILLGWPVELITSNRAITSRFGNRTINGQPDFHNGLDFRGKPNEYAIAAYDGTVNEVKRNGDFTYIVLKHKNPKNNFIFYTKYCHLDPNSFFYTNPGPFVKKGKRLAKIDSRITGTSTAPHLHFEVLIQYPDTLERVDPMDNQVAIIKV